MIDRDDLRQVLVEIFEERARIDAETHGQHHAWIQARIDAEKTRSAVYFEITKTVAQWSVLGLLGGLLYWFRNGHWPN